MGRDARSRRRPWLARPSSDFHGMLCPRPMRGRRDHSLCPGARRNRPRRRRHSDDPRRHSLCLLRVSYGSEEQKQRSRAARQRDKLAAFLLTERRPARCRRDQDTGAASGTGGSSRHEQFSPPADADVRDPFAVTIRPRPQGISAFMCDSTPGYRVARLSTSSASAPPDTAQLGLWDVELTPTCRSAAKRGLPHRAVEPRRRRIGIAVRRSAWRGRVTKRRAAYAQEPRALRQDHRASGGGVPLADMATQIAGRAGWVLVRRPGATPGALPDRGRDG